MNETKTMNRTLTLSNADKNELKDKLTFDFKSTNTIICNDINKIKNSIPKKYFNLILLDPPYNITKKYGSDIFRELPDDEYYEYIKYIIDHCLSVLDDNGTLYICGDWKTSYIQRKVLEWFENQGMCDVINRITWSRDKGRGALNNWKNNCEDIYMVVKYKNHYYFNVDAVKIRKTVLAPYKDKNGNNKDWTTDENGNYRMTYPSNVWYDIVVPFWSMAENTNHPTQKSEKLYAKLILASSKEGDIIYEPFAGVCTGCVTAKKLNRNYVGVEMYEEYCLLGLKRLKLAEVNKNIQGYEDGLFRDK